MHAAALESGFDNELIGTFDGTIADGPAVLLKGGIGQEGGAFFEVGQGTGQFWLVGLLGDGLTQGGEQGRGPLGFELVELLP